MTESQQPLLEQIEGNWKKKKGVAPICLDDGSLATAELQWYEAHGVGKVKMKVQQWL